MSSLVQDQTFASMGGPIVRNATSVMSEHCNIRRIYSVRSSFGGQRSIASVYRHFHKWPGCA